MLESRLPCFSSLLHYLTWKWTVLSSVAETSCRRHTGITILTSSDYCLNLIDMYLSCFLIVSERQDLLRQSLFTCLEFSSPVPGEEHFIRISCIHTHKGDRAVLSGHRTEIALRPGCHMDADRSNHQSDLSWKKWDVYADKISVSYLWYC